MTRQTMGWRWLPIRPELRHLYRGPAWAATRARIRDRAGDRCQDCGRANGSVYIGKRRLVVVSCGAAHRNGIAGDDRDENLAWWCAACHLKNDAAQHKRTREARKDRQRPLFAEIAA
jgi:hypothetical protein